MFGLQSTWSGQAYKKFELGILKKERSKNEKNDDFFVWG